MRDCRLQCRANTLFLPSFVNAIVVNGCVTPPCSIPGEPIGIPATEMPAMAGLSRSMRVSARVVVPRTSVTVDEQSERRLAVLPEGVSLQQLVNSLNALGVGPRDMISILQAIKAAGALQAEIEVM